VKRDRRRLEVWPCTHVDFIGRGNREYLNRRVVGQVIKPAGFAAPVNDQHTSPCVHQNSSCGSPGTANPASTEPHPLRTPVARPRTRNHGDQVVCHRCAEWKVDSPPVRKSHSGEKLGSGMGRAGLRSQRQVLRLAFAAIVSVTPSERFVRSRRPDCEMWERGSALTPGCSRSRQRCCSKKRTSRGWAAIGATGSFQP
jgi:hypothetical protein